MPRGRLALAVLLAGVVAGSLSACGGGSGPTDVPTPTPPPTPPPPRVVFQDSGVSIPVGFATGAYFDISATGAIDATVDYTHSDSLLLVWIAKGRCTPDQFNADQCEYVATSFSGPKPRKVSASGQPAGAYTLVVGNLGPKEEAISVQVVFTQASAGGSAGASSRRPASPAFLTPLPAHARP